MKLKKKLDALKCHEIYSRFFKSYEYTLEFIFNDELKSVLMNITCNVVIGKELLEFQLFHLYQRAEIFHRIARIDPELKRACIRVIK